MLCRHQTPASIDLEIVIVVGDLVTLVQTAIALGREPFLTVVVDQVIEDQTLSPVATPAAAFLVMWLSWITQPGPLRSWIASCCSGVRKFRDDKSPHRDIRRARDHRIAVNRVLRELPPSRIASRLPPSSTSPDLGTRADTW